MRDGQPPPGITFIALGPIGDALMMLAVLAETDAAAIGPVHICALRNAPLMRELAARYPRIAVEDCSPSWRAFFRIPRGGAIFVPPTFGTHAPWLKALVALWSLLPGTRTVGFRDRGRWQPYDRVVEYALGKRYLDNLRHAFRLAGIRVQDEGMPPALELAPRMPEGMPRVSGMPYLVLHPFASNPMRSLPQERWRVLVKEIRRRYPDHAVVITGSHADAAAAGTLAEGIAGVDVASGLPLLEIAGLIRGSALYIGVDTGITHLAAVLQHTGVVIGNRSNPTWLPTYEPAMTVLTNPERCTCRGDKRGGCLVEEDGKKYLRCLYDVRDEDIYAAIQAVLDQIRETKDFG